MWKSRDSLREEALTYVTHTDYCIGEGGIPFLMGVMLYMHSSLMGTRPPRAPRPAHTITRVYKIKKYKRLQ